ncbi:MAG TPA: hypothetical protein VF322_15505 [Gammaproteobacteria bacterium]
MPQGSVVIKEGVRVIQGTPATAIGRSTLFLRMWKAAAPGKAARPRTLASLHMVRPGPSGYIVKELLPELELDPHAALDKAVAIAKRGDVEEIYVNADLSKLPPPSRRAASG